MTPHTTAGGGNFVTAFPSDLGSRSGSEAMSMVSTPAWVGRVAIILAIILLLMPLGAIFAPWQQTVRGSGQVTAYAPLERQQTIEAPISGRVVQWWVQEGDMVEKDQKLCEIQDIDPDRVGRLERELDATIAKLQAYEGKVEQYTQQAANMRAVGDLTVQAASFNLKNAEQKVESAEEKLRSANADLSAADAQVSRNRTLISSGAISQRDLEVAERDYAKAFAAVNAATADLAASIADRDSVERDTQAAQARADSSVNSIVALLNDARGQIEDARASRVKLEGQVARQKSQLVVAPRAGVVFRLASAQGGEIVKEADPLLTLVPDTTDRAVEMLIDGNDAPLIMPGSEVRLQFEGWPAVQFAGWPAVAVGTFGGTVSFVDATDNGDGQFRIVVQPDDKAEWPEDRFLRQGVRAKGWVLLNEVPIWREVWRQLNGFPPVVAQDAPDGVARKRIK